MYIYLCVYIYIHICMLWDGAPAHGAAAEVRMNRYV